MIDNIFSQYQLPGETQRSLSASFRTARECRRHSRREASVRSGVPEGTIRRFEDTGDISLRQLLMLCDVYGSLVTAGSIFPKPEPQSMDELIAMSRSEWIR